MFPRTARGARQRSDLIPAVSFLGLGRLVCAAVRRLLPLPWHRISGIASILVWVLILPFRRSHRHNSLNAMCGHIGSVELCVWRAAPEQVRPPFVAHPETAAAEQPGQRPLHHRHRSSRSLESIPRRAGRGVLPRLRSAHASCR